MVISPIDKNIAGKYRGGDVAIAGSGHKPPLAIEIPHKMQELISWFRQNQMKLHPIELASLIHHKIVSIHPFEDGNGRTARIVMDIILLREGFPLVVILKNDRKKYYETLSKADNGNYLPFIEFVTQSVERSLNIYLETIIGIKSDSERFLTLSELSKHFNFSPKYFNLLVRKGKLIAHKEGRNWLSTIESVNSYLAGKRR